MSRSLGLPLAGSLVAFVFAFAPGLASAATCGSTYDCAKGELCMELPGPVCDVMCPADGYCPPCATPVPTFECQPGAACTSDADCNPDLTCALQFFDCAPPVCPVGVACNALIACPPPSGVCQPRAGQPCVADSDCGPNYMCDVQVACGGWSGGGGVGGAGGGMVYAVDAGAMIVDAGYYMPPVYCAPPTTGTCVSQQIYCGAPSDCPAGWICEHPPVFTCGITADCAPGPMIPSVCVPPYGGGSGGFGGGGVGGGAGAGGGGGWSTSGTAGAGTTSTVPPGGGEVVIHRGCQVGGATDSSGGAWISLLGALAVVFGCRRGRGRRV